MADKKIEIGESEGKAVDKGVVGAINKISEQLKAINDSIKDLKENKNEPTSPQEINIQRLIISVDELFASNPKNLFKRNTAVWWFLLSIGSLAILGLLNLFTHIGDNESLSLSVSIVAVIFAFFSFYPQMKETNRITVRDEIVNKVIISYNKVMNRDTIIGGQVFEETIIRELIILRRKNKNLPLYEVYKSNPAMFETRELLERLYS